MLNFTAVELSSDVYVLSLCEDFDLTTKRSLAKDVCICLNNQELRLRLASLSFSLSLTCLSGFHIYCSASWWYQLLHVSTASSFFCLLCQAIDVVLVGLDVSLDLFVGICILFLCPYLFCSGGTVVHYSFLPFRLNLLNVSAAIYCTPCVDIS